MSPYDHTTGDVSTDPELKRRLGEIPGASEKLPEGFMWGFATAAYQIEGAHDIDGRGPSVWDTACHDSPTFTADSSSGDVAIDSYHLFPEDLSLLSAYKANSYRFSISWSRILPRGTLDGGVNEAGIGYYDRLIDGLVQRGIRPLVTLFHWDLPTALEEEYGGWSNTTRIVPDFTSFARLCFERFGDRVKNWITINEPMCVLLFGSQGLKRGWSWERDCYQSAHSLILAHAHAVDLYRREFKPVQRGEIGITLNCDWAEPIDDSEEARRSATRRMDQALGWFADPIYLGHYPETLVEENPDMPEFTEEQWGLVKGSSDFFGLNSYSTLYTTGRSLRPKNGSVFPSDPRCSSVPKTNGHALTNGHSTPNGHSTSNGRSDLNGHTNGNGYANGDGHLAPTTAPIDDYSNMASPLDGYQESTQKANPDVRRRHPGVEKSEGKWIGNGGECGWLKDVPWGFRALLNYINKRYLVPNSLYLIVTENGFCSAGEHLKPLEQVIQDSERVDYFRGYLRAVLRAIQEDGVDIRGYMAWSLADNFEWKAGYIPRFGCTHVDRSRLDFPRTPKDSAWFLKAFFEQNLAK